MAKLKVLFIDDDAAVRRAVRRFLEDEFDVTDAHDAATAAAAAEQQAVDVVLVDFQLADEDAFDVMEAIIPHASHLRRRVVVLTLSESTESFLSLLCAQGWQLLDSPPDRNELVRALRRASKR